MNGRIFRIVTLLLMATILGACGGNNAAGDGTSGRLTIAGSSALQPLVDHAAQSFQASNRGAQITVSAGGSGAGRNNVCNGSIDVGMSDVPLSEEERNSLRCTDAVETVVAIQAFGVAANQQGPGPALRALTKEQMQGLFNGTIRNWSEVGGENQAVVVINRAAGSGTRAKMAQYLFDGDDTQFAVGAAEVDSSQTVVNNLRQTPGAISYLGLAFLSDARLTAFGIWEGPNSEIIEPTDANAANGTWPIGGPGYAITKGPPSPLAQAFIDYMISPEFAEDQIWGNLGFVSPALSPAASR
jgi:phosphate transport system substrate-binding protein